MKPRPIIRGRRVAQREIDFFPFFRVLSIIVVSRKSLISSDRAETALYFQRADRARDT